MIRRLVLTAMVALTGAPAAAQTLAVEAADNATVQPAGPRSGVNGKRFFNVEGSANGAFASFGVADFVFTPPADEATRITALTLELTQSNAAFSTAGDVSVYLSGNDAAAIIQPGDPDQVIYQSGNDGIDSVDTALAPLSYLGTFSYEVVASGSVDSFDLLAELDAARTTALLDAVNTGSTIRLVIVPDGASVAATWAGSQNLSYAGPTLSISVGDVNPPVADTAFLNELHYDNVGTDAGEFVEIAGPAGHSLEGWSLVLYNGSGGAVYGTTTFGASDVLTSDGSADSSGYGFFVQSYPSNGLQNGSPDGLALVDPDGDVVEFLSYEGSFVAVGGAADGQTSSDIGVSEGSGTSLGYSLQRSGTGLTGADFAWATEQQNTSGATNAGQVFEDPSTPTPAIPAIQGAGHRSPYAGQVVKTTGIVTRTGTFNAVGTTGRLTGFFLQDALGDGDDATSDAIFVASGKPVSPGDEVTVKGAVIEQAPAAGAVTYTRIQASSVTVVSSNDDLPAPVLLGAAGRLPPTEIIDDDAFGTIPDLGSFDPQTDGLDFWESLEGMRVTVLDAVAVSPTSGFGEIFAVTDRGAQATGLSARGTLNIAPDDFNPERIQLDAGIPLLPAVDTGALLGDVTGVVTYDFGNYQVEPEAELAVAPGSLPPETTDLLPGATHLTIASYNVLNLDPNDDPSEPQADRDVADGRFDAIAAQIVHALGAPDVLGLAEVQDDSGGASDGTTSAMKTLQLLADRIVAAGGPAYDFIDNPFVIDGQVGGQPGGNIRCVLLYNPDRVELVPGSVRTVPDPTAFTGSRVPLAATFLFNGNAVTVVANHFSSKGGSAPLYGTAQPFDELQEDPTVNGGLDERIAQAAEVRAFVEAELAIDPDANVVVLGDLNEFEFVSPVASILGTVLENLTLQLDPVERYSYVFDGNSQSLDHILVTPHLAPLSRFDAVHVNAEFAVTASRASDHDPLVASLELLPTCQGLPATVYVGDDGRIVGGLLHGHPFRGLLMGTLRRDVIVGTPGNDVIVSLTGGDVACGGDGDDVISGGIGADVLDGGPGGDICAGGIGRDRKIDCER